jgi:hypothetical protein
MQISHILDSAASPFLRISHKRMEERKRLSPDEQR